MTSLNPYLSFRNDARAAMQFYRDVFGGDLVVDTFASYENMVADPEDKDLVMHAQLTTPDGLVLMASDTPSRMEYTPPSGISISVGGDDEAQLERFWTALAEGGTVTMPFEVPPWGGRFGMLRDRFGIHWMLAYTPAT